MSSASYPRGAGLVLAVLACAALVACGDAGSRREPEARAPAARVVLTANDRAVWRAGPPDRSSVPVLLYHGIAPVAGFSDRADAFYGLDPANFVKQMMLLHHAGYRTITLERYVRFIRGERVRLPAHPLLLTFDDARADSFSGADRIMRKLRYNAVMFVDVGAVDRADREYLTWPQLAAMQRSGRWDVQLHAGRGHHNIRYGSAPRDVGPFYAYRAMDEGIADWTRRVFSDLDWGRRRLEAHIPGYRPLAFAPPYGNYGQETTNDSRIPRRLGAWLARRYAVVFTQDRTVVTRPGERGPLGRLQLTRRMSGGDLHAALVSAQGS